MDFQGIWAQSTDVHGRMEELDKRLHDVDYHNFDTASPNGLRGAAVRRRAIRMTQRVELMGCMIDNLSMEETLGKIEQFIDTGRPHQHVVVNVDKVVKANRDAELRSIINDCDLVNVDGMPLVWASRLLGIPLKERVAGVDLFEALMKRAAVRGWRIFLLGGREDVVNRVRTIYEQRYPGLIIAGWRDGYWTADHETAVVEQVKAARPHVLFLAISSPKKEYFLKRYQSAMNVPFLMGVGGTFDVAAGKVKRAPLWMQRSGLEWFYRFLQEPRRMFRRYFIDDSVFLWLLLKQVVRR
jgi:N-acetylglucosaminyldiphosphoundecaprenol N-acetyl-beta-D-mannosaminyltransferase